MRYFTKEMWAGWQTRDSGYDEADFHRRLEDYWKQFARLRRRLGKGASTFLRTAVLHDARVITLAIENRDETKAKPTHAARRQQFPTAVEIFLVPAGNARKRYTLRYERVRRVDFAFPSDRPMFDGGMFGINDWGYDEVTAADQQFLRHEVMFASGATLLIEFIDLKCRATRTHR